MDSTALRVYVRNTALARVGQVDDYTSLTVVPRYNTIGAYTMEISADSSKASILTEGNGLIIRTGAGDTILSGPIRTVDWSRSESDAGSGKLTISGVDDTALLAQYTCWPNPGAVIGSQGDAVYKISATAAETAMRALVNVNAAPAQQPPAATRYSHSPPTASAARLSPGSSTSSTTSSSSCKTSRAPQGSDSVSSRSGRVSSSRCTHPLTGPGPPGSPSASGISWTPTTRPPRRPAPAPWWWRVGSPRLASAKPTTGPTPVPRAGHRAVR